MSVRCSAKLMLALFVFASFGCSKKPVPRATPSAKASTLAPEQAPPAPPPEPESAPGEAVRLTIPENGGTWLWAVGRAQPALPSQTLSFPGLQPFAVTGFAVRPEINRAIVSIKNEKKGQPVATRFVYCDTSAGKILTEWQIAGQQAILDLSPDGRAILSTYPQPGQDRTILRMWVIGSDGQLRRSSWTPHTATRADGLRQEPTDRYDTASALEIRWAGFVGNERIVSSSRMGQLRIFETDGLKPLSYLDGSPGRPAITPDGSKIAAFTGNAVTLIDPMSGVVIGTRWVGQLPPHPALAFSPDGSKLAIGGNGKALIMNLSSGEIELLLLPKLRVTDTGMYDKPFGWAGNTCLYADEHLFDLRLTNPIWDFTGVEYVQFRGSRVWACSRAGGTSTSTLAAYDLPQPRASARTANICSNPENFALKPGDKIRIDVTGLPENRRADVTKSLEQRLAKLGFHVDPAAPAVLFASVDATGTKAVTCYSGYDIYSYLKYPAELRLVVNGRELWSDAWAVEPPLKIRLPLGVTLANHLKPMPIGEPNYQLFASAPLPFYLAGPQAPNTVLGTTELKGERLKSWLGW